MSDSKQNELQRRILAGESVEGLTGYYHHKNEYVESCLYLPVAIVRMEVKGCNVLIIGTIVGGAGELPICPTCWLDTLDDVKDFQAVKLRIAKRKADRDAIHKLHYRHQRRSALEKYVAERMSSRQQQEFWQAVQEEFVMESTPTKIPSKASQSTVNNLIDKATDIVCCLADDDDNDANEDL